MQFVPIYASILGVLFVVLSVRTLRLRRSLKIAIGDSGNPAMLRAMRVHSNFAEYVPMSLILMYFVEVQGASAYMVNGLGLALVAGRLSHAFGVSQLNENYTFRVFGMAMTLTTIIVCCLYLVARYAQQIGT